jgi:predicted P-loop ATPase
MNEHPERPAHIPENFKTRDGQCWPFRHAWTYVNAEGQPIGHVARFDRDGGKQVVPYFKRNGTGWKAGGPEYPVLFGVDRLNRLADDPMAMIVEGEKAAAALHSLELPAVTSQGGSRKATSGDWPALAGVATVYLLPDNDRPGEGYMRDVSRILTRLKPAPALRLVRLPDLPDKGDVVDWLAARLPEWDGLAAIPDSERERLRAELLALMDGAEPIPDDWLKEPEAAADRPADSKPRLKVRQRRNGDIELVACLRNAVFLLSETAEWRGVIGFNQFRQRIEKRLPTPYGGAAGAWSDVDTSETLLWLDLHHGVAFEASTVDRAIATIADRNGFNMAQDRLRELAAHWDGERRLESWLEDYLGATATRQTGEYLKAIGAAWLKGVAARVLFPGCKRDDVLVLIGEQGWLKSTAANALADAIHPESFTDSVDLGNLAEAKIQIRGVIIAELGELAGLARGEVEAIKAFVATKSDHFRDKYGRYAQDFSRTVSFFGTTNETAFLKDPTGNRRWYPVSLDGPIDIPAFKAVLPQLLGEATRRVMDGEAWHVTARVALEQAQEIRDEHYDHDAWTDDILRIAEGFGDFFTLAELMDSFNIPRPQQSVMVTQRIGRILRKNGYEPGRERIKGTSRNLRRGWRKKQQQ